MKFDILSFIFSLNWLWIIVIFLVYRLCNKAIILLVNRQSIKRAELVRNTKYSEEEIMNHLDFIIKEALEEYVLFNIRPKNIYYINTKLETEIVTDLAENVPGRISSTLMDHLELIYSYEYIGEAIGQRIYLFVVNYVVEFNINNDQISQNKEKN